MAGYVKGSIAHYRFLKGRLIEVSDKLKTAKKYNLGDKSKLFIEEVNLMDQLMKYFPHGQPK